MNPFEVLDVGWDADKAALVKAQARALKARKHAPQVIAEAFRALMDEDARVLAAFIQTQWGRAEPVVLPVVPEQEPEPLPPYPDVPFQELLAELDRKIAEDEAAAARIAPPGPARGLPVPAQLLLSLERVRRADC